MRTGGPGLAFLLLAACALFVASPSNGVAASDWISRSINSQKPAAKPEETPTRPKPKPEAKPKPNATQQARTAVTQATSQAGGDIDACSAQFSQKPLYDCVAQALEKLASAVEKAPANRALPPNVVGALRSAAAELKAAPDKAAAISAVDKAKAVLVAAISVVKVSAKASADSAKPGQGDRAALEAIAGVLDKAAGAIQRKG